MYHPIPPFPPTDLERLINMGYSEEYARKVLEQKPKEA